jgi:hypothetical protein
MSLQRADLVVFGVLVIWWLKTHICHQITKSPDFTKRIYQLLYLAFIRKCPFHFEIYLVS